MGTDLNRELVELRSKRAQINERIKEIKALLATDTKLRGRPVTPETAAARDRMSKASSMRGSGLTLRAIGEELGVSVERVRQLIAAHERRTRLAADG